VLVALLVFTLALSSTAFAQNRHAVNPSVLSQTVTQQVAQHDAHRAAIHEALSRPEVRDVAQKSGLDLDRINASVDTLSGNSLAQVAAAAQQVNQTLVGGASTVVISTTTIIVALLVVILIVVAVD
jgi:cell division protein FtsL